MDFLRVSRWWVDWHIQYSRYTIVQGYNYGFRAIMQAQPAWYVRVLFDETDRKSIQTARGTD